jgi:DNA polymerase III alpha subunit
VSGKTDITPLHVWSGYSLLRGPTHVERLVARAARMGLKRLALTDVNGLYGAPVFHRLAREAGLRPIIGADLHADGFRAVALVENDAGYENLCRIISRIHAASLDIPGDLAALAEGLHFIAESASPARLLAPVLNGRLWLGIDPATQTRSQLRELTRLAERTKLPLVATGKALFADREDHDAARLLAAIRLGAAYDTVTPGQLPHPAAHLRGPRRLAADLAPHAAAVANNRRLAQRCARFALLPRRCVFPEFPCPTGESTTACLRRLCTEGLSRRYGRRVPPAAVPRLERELRLIERKGFSGYFLVVWDIVRYARGRGVPVAGRGSGGSSLAAYLLGITNVCPLAHEIPFERFLNERREDFPDLDIDFCWRIRDDVIDYAFRRWGEDHAAMVCTHNTFQAPSALRETAKAFGCSDDQVSRLDEADLREAAFAPVLRLSRRILGLPRLLSVHPGGVVLTRKPIDHHAPVQRAAKGVRITQYDKDGVEDAGLVKLDLLGNRSLSTIRFACDLVRRRTGRAIDAESLPASDGATVATLRSADTVGCNQLESPAMRHLLRAMQPAGTRDLMKALALIRPGAASIGMKEAFIRRQRGIEAIPHGHPQVDALLAGTGGVMLYEDDVMLVAAAMMGTSLAEGDRFRKAIQTCRSDEERVRLSRAFLGRWSSASGAGGEPGRLREWAKSMWVQMAKFNAYSFCRAHAASYAMLGYAVAYLKSHHPLEFWVAALNNNQSMYHPRVYVEQAKRAGIRFLLPDVNRSQAEFAPEGEAIRVGLNRVAGFGPGIVERILEARRAGGAFRSVGDFLRRTRLAAEEMRTLILCGGFDALDRKRPVLMMELNLLLAMRAHQAPRDPPLLSAEPAFPQPPGDYSPRRKYLDERRILGFSVREHIMAIHRKRGLAPPADQPPAGNRGGGRAPLVTSRDLPGLVGRRVRIAGVIEAVRTAPTRNGRSVTFLTLDDEFGLFEATCFPGRAAGPFNRYGPYVVSGTVEEQYGTVTVTAEGVTLCAPTGGRHHG